MSVFWVYLRGLVSESFHGALRVVEITEVIAAVIIYALSYFFHDIKDALAVICMIIIVLFIFTFVFGLLIVAYRGDKEKTEQLRSGLILELEQFIIGELPDKEVTTIVVVANVSNTGEPGILDNYSMKVTLSNGMSIIPSQQTIPRGLVLSRGYGQRIIVVGNNASQEQPTVYDSEQALYERTLVPIAKGARVRGVLMFWAVGMKPDAFVGATCELIYHDIRNRAYSAKHIISKDQLTDSNRYFPGLG